MEEIEQKIGDEQPRKFPYGLGGKYERRNELRQMGQEILNAILEGRIDEIKDLCDQYRREANEWNKLIKEFNIGSSFII